MNAFLTSEGLLALLTLTVLEIVLGVVFSPILRVRVSAPVKLRDAYRR